MKEPIVIRRKGCRVAMETCCPLIHFLYLKARILMRIQLTTRLQARDALVKSEPSLLGLVIIYRCVSVGSRSSELSKAIRLIFS